MGKRIVPTLPSSELCPSCGSENNVVQNSRPAKLGRLRRRVCQDCGTRWSTIELHKYADESERYSDVLRLLSDVQGKINSILGLMMQTGQVTKNYDRQQRNNIHSVCDN